MDPLREAGTAEMLRRRRKGWSSSGDFVSLSATAIAYPSENLYGRFARCTLETLLKSKTSPVQARDINQTSGLAPKYQIIPRSVASAVAPRFVVNRAGLSLEAS